MSCPYSIPWTDTRRPFVRGACANERCGAAFVALTPAQRYCSPRCADRARSRRYHAAHRAAANARQLARYHRRRAAR